MENIPQTALLQRASLSMSRRSLLTAAPAAGLGAFMAGAVSAAANGAASPIMILFRQWEAEQAAAHDLPEAECDAACERMHAMQREMCELPATSLQDLAAKVVAHTGDGMFAIEDGSSLWAEVRALVGGAS